MLKGVLAKEFCDSQHWSVCQHVFSLNSDIRTYSYTLAGLHAEEPVIPAVVVAVRLIARWPYDLRLYSRGVTLRDAFS
jgi:hypothetical protein